MRLTVVLVAAALLATACTDSPPPPPPEGVLRIGFPNTPILDEPSFNFALWTPLIDYDPTTSKVTPRAAESVTSTDLKTWTIKLKPDKYIDGAPVTAQSYVDAWAMLHPLPGGVATAVDRQTIQVVFAQPMSEVPAMLASERSLPVRWDKPEAGNGPFMLDPRQPGDPWRLVRMAKAPGKVNVVEVRLFDDPAKAYDEVAAGTLDMSLVVPGSRHDAMHKDFADRHAIWPRPRSAVLSFGADAPEAAARFAVSMSLDRKALAAGPMDNQVDAATALIPPALAPGERSGACRACNLDAAAAKSLKAQSGLTSVALKAGPVADQVRSVLGVDTKSGVKIEQKDLRVDSLSPYEFFTQLGVPSVQQFLDAAAASADPAERAQQYRLAENQILRDLPVIPLWTAHGHAIWSPRVRDVAATAAHGIDLAAISL
ncbi:ABC transporter substrate-binding protein [Actinocrispum sp. NPDC049592]|uniref:peptide ABC transporter substrate-binding protein n=1 Tax=Actinocrispum sp. NPDC049592 TaxID=3154835 RepID=UPI003430104B